MINWSINIATSKPCCLFTVSRIDGTVEYVTNASKDITIGPTTWTKHAGLQPGVRTDRSDGTPPTIGFGAHLGSAAPFRLRDVVRGKYEFARVQIELTSQDNPVTRDFVFDGLILGESTYTQHGQGFFDLMSIYGFPRDIFIQKFTLMCRHMFGDWKFCQIPVFSPPTAVPYNQGVFLNEITRSTPYLAGQSRRHHFAANDDPEDFANVYLLATTNGTTAASEPAFSSTVGDFTVDGTVTWETKNAWARAAKIVSVSNHTITLDRLPDPRATGNSAWFNPLKFVFRSGEYENRAFKGAGWDSDTLTLETYLPCPLAAADDWIEISPDCDKTHSMCVTKFANAINHGGFPFQQGAKAQAMQLGYAP